MRPLPPAAIAIAAALLGSCTGADAHRPFGDPARGSAIVDRQACGSCHVIPGLPLADGAAGPPLDQFARRTVIAGLLPNTPDNLVRWLASPQSVKPGNAMPDMGMTPQDARDVAAFLETLR